MKIGAACFNNLITRRHDMRRLLQLVLVILVLTTFVGVAGAKPLAQDGSGEDGGEGSVYIVKAGDSLAQLARLFLSNANAFPSIVAATNALAVDDSSYRTIDDPNIILVGQKLFIPGVTQLPEQLPEVPGGEATAPESGTDVDEPTAAENAAFLAGTNWNLASLAGAAPVEGTSPTLNFASAVESSGSTGCNRFNAAYETDGFHISFGPAAGTLVACPEAISAQEQAFFQMLENAAFVTVGSGTMQLFDQDSTLLADFTAVTDNQLQTQWEVTAFNNGRQAVVGVIDGTSLTANFGADGTVSGSGGCNNYTGSYTTDGSAIAIGPLASTLRACADMGVDEQELQFLAAMESAAVFNISGDTLELRTADDALAVMMRMAAE
jgi:heat shock protein HslJ